MSLIKNMSTVDRIIRIIAGIALTYAGFFNDGITHNFVINLLIGIFGLINIGSALLGICPAYSLAGISSCKKDKSE